MDNKWIVFDAMGVIFEVGDDVAELLIPFLRKRRNISSEEVNSLYYEASLGNITSKEFWEALGFGAEYPEIEQEYLDHCLTLDPEFKAVAEKLKTRFHLALLSNDISEWSAYLRASHGLNQLLEICVVSGDVHLRKPDPAIFRILLNRLQSKPGDCVFIDDNPNNLKTASELGLRTILFVRNSSGDNLPGGKVIGSFEQLPDLL